MTISILNMLARTNVLARQRVKIKKVSTNPVLFNREKNQQNVIQGLDLKTEIQTDRPISVYAGCTKMSNAYMQAQELSQLQGATNFLARKTCIKNQQKSARILHDSCPKNYQSILIFMIFVRKMYKILEFCMIFARKMPEFYTIIARKIFFPNFRGARAIPAPRLLRLWSNGQQVKLRGRIRKFIDISGLLFYDQGF